MEDLATVDGDGVDMVYLYTVAWALEASEASVDGAQAVDFTDPKFLTRIKSSIPRLNQNGKPMMTNL